MYCLYRQNPDKSTPLHTSGLRSLWGLKEFSGFALLPLHLFLMFLLSGLGLHLLHLDGIWFSPPHIQLVVTHAQSQDPLIDPQPWSIEHEILELNKQAGLIHQNGAMFREYDGETVQYIKLHIDVTLKMIISISVLQMLHLGL